MNLGHWNRVGKNQEHAKFIFNVSNNLLEGIGFGLVEDLEKMGINAQDTIDVLGCIEVNEYNGRRKLQINIKDVSRAGEVKIVEQKVEAKQI
jgi:single-stranded-DNA-specific exonuclease